MIGTTADDWGLRGVDTREGTGRPTSEMCRAIRSAP